MDAEKKKIFLAITFAILLTLAIVGASYYLFPSDQSFSSQQLSGEVYAVILGAVFAASVTTAVVILVLSQRKKKEN